MLYHFSFFQICNIFFAREDRKINKATRSLEQVATREFFVYALTTYSRKVSSLSQTCRVCFCCTVQRLFDFPNGLCPPPDFQDIDNLLLCISSISRHSQAYLAGFCLSRIYRLNLIPLSFQPRSLPIGPRPSRDLPARPTRSASTIFPGPEKAI